MRREHDIKLESGEYTHYWNGFSPFYAGCFYGNSVCLGGEEKYSNCYGFFAGIVDIDWWVTAELEKLTREEKDELLFFLKRNKEFDEQKKKMVPELAKALGVEPYQIYRIPNKTLYEFVNLVHSHSNEAIAEKTKKAREEYQQQQRDHSEFLERINSKDFTYK